MGIYENGKITDVTDVDFKEYCANVLLKEFNYNGNNRKEARLAQAAAIKNYGWYYCLHPKYKNDKGEMLYNVVNTTARQRYDPSIAMDDIPSYIKESIEATWNYVVLDNNYDIFPLYYRASVADDSHAVKGGGVMSQREAVALACTCGASACRTGTDSNCGCINGDKGEKCLSKGYDWQEILHYYYDHSSGADYYESNKVAVGDIRIVNYANHTASMVSAISVDDSYHRGICLVCGRTHNAPHKYTYYSDSNIIKCSVCFHVSPHQVLVLPDETE